MSVPSSPLASLSPSVPAAAAAAAPTQYIAYELRDGSNVYATITSLVWMDTTRLIHELQKAVFAANANKLRGRDYTDLDVYPPGSSSDVLSDHSLARDPEDAISSLLPAPEEQDRIKRRVIIVARPLPPTGGVQGEKR